MLLEKLIGQKVNGLETVEIELTDQIAIVREDAAGVSRALLRTAAIGLAPWRNPTRAGPSNGWTKGEADKPAFNPEETGAAVELYSAAGSYWERRDVDNRTETFFHNLARADHLWALVYAVTGLEEDNTTEDAKSRTGTTASKAAAAAAAAARRIGRQWSEGAADLFARTAAALCRRHPTAPEPEGEKAIVLVERLDTMVDTAELGRILNAFAGKFPQTQLIATSRK